MDSKDINELLIKHKDDIESAARRFSNSSAVQSRNDIDLDDLIQEASIAFVRAHETYNANLSEFTTHFNNVINNALIDFLRGLSVNYEDTVPLQDALHVPAPDLIGQAEQQLDINKALLVASVPPLHREIVLEYFGIGCPDSLTQSELADKHGLSQQHISRIVEESLRKIKSFLQEQRND